MSTQLSDNELIQEARGGSRAAADLLMRRHERSVYHVCLAMTRHPDDALDATQETFLRALTKLDSFQGSGAFRGWLLQVANRTCLNALRARKRRLEDVELTELNAPTFEADQEVRVTRLEIGQRLRTELQKLNDREGLAVRLRYFDQLAIREVATVLDCTEGTAKSLLFRSLRKMRHGMAPNGAGAE